MKLYIDKRKRDQNKFRLTMSKIVKKRKILLLKTSHVLVYDMQGEFVRNKSSIQLINRKLNFYSKAEIIDTSWCEDEG